MRSIWIFCLVLVVVLGIMTFFWGGHIFQLGQRAPNIMAGFTNYDKADDLTGTLWENQEGKSTLYFSSADHLVYSLFDNNIYQRDAKRKLRSISGYEFVNTYKIIIVSRLGMQFNVLLNVQKDTLNHRMALVDQENREFWLRETGKDYAPLTK
jgi:hypothetical protein